MSGVMGSLMGTKNPFSGASFLQGMGQAGLSPLGSELFPSKDKSAPGTATGTGTDTGVANPMDDLMKQYILHLMEQNNAPTGGGGRSGAGQI
jgi:hypothetical protein